MPTPGSETTLPCSPWPFLAPPQGSDEIGRLAEYRVLRLLGKGGMGMVFQAEDTQLRRLVALKVMLPEVAAQEQSRVRFLREARAAAALKHDHVVTIYQVGEDRGVPFLAMEFLKGKSLADWLAGGRQASVGETLIIGRQVAKGLAAAHKAGLIHRDIKPANLWLEAPAGRVKVLDFGLARWSDVRTDNDLSKMTREGEIVGTPAFMAPEQARGESVTAQSDLFSLGCVLYRLASGRPPFRGDSLVAVLSAVLTHTPQPVRELNAEVPERFAALVEKLLEKKPADRPASAQAVVDELLAIQRDFKEAGGTAAPAQAETIALGAESDTIATRAAQAPRSSQRQRWLLAGAGLACLAVIAAVMVIVAGGGTAEVSKRPAPEAERDDGPEKPPAGSTALQATPAQPIDLMALIDTNAKDNFGLWSAEDGTLQGSQVGQKPFWLVFPWNPPSEYRLRMTVISKRACKNLTIGLASGGARFNLAVDAQHEDRYFTGLASWDGKLVWDRTDSVQGQYLRQDTPTELAITVKRDRVALAIDNVEVYSHEGDLARSTRPLAQPRQPLGIGGMGPGILQFENIVLEPLGADRGKPLEVDLLSLIDPERDARSGNWTFRGGKLFVGQKGEARMSLPLPWNPPAEYRLLLTVERIGGKGPLGLALASGDARFNLVIDSQHADKVLTGLGNIGGREIDERRDPRRGSIFTRQIPLDLIVTVRKDGVSLDVSEKRVYEWHGDLLRVSRAGRQSNVPLALWSIGPGAFEFQKIVLEPLAPDRGLPRKELPSEARLDD